MNYYEKLIDKLSTIIDTSPKEALKIIDEELRAPYIPKDILNKLKDFRSKINIKDEKDFKLDLDTVLSYLKEDEDRQCIAVEELSKLNLRDFDNEISDFLLSNGSLRAKIKLVLSLCEQESNKTYSILKDNKIYQFVPKKLILPEKSEFYKNSIDVLNEYYLKNPDMLHLAKELLYNDYIFNLPESRDIKDVKYITSKIISYINNLFNN